MSMVNAGQMRVLPWTSAPFTPVETNSHFSARTMFLAHSTGRAVGTTKTPSQPSACRRIGCYSEGRSETSPACARIVQMRALFSRDKANLRKEIPFDSL